MKIYFGASISLNRSMLPIYQKVVDEVKKLGHTVLSEYVVDPQLQVGDGLTPNQLFKRETQTIEKCDVMIAEVTAPSWGTAFLMEHALDNGKPVLALFYKETQQPLPMMIQGHPELYVEHYDEDNMETVLKHNLKYFEEMKNRDGKLIVIDGGDGSGKATQTQMLLDYLKEKKIKAKYITFPRYKTSFHGKHVGRFLAGEFSKNEVSPYLSSLAFALDRLTAKNQIIGWLKEGSYVVADRYVSASLAYQAAKVPKDKQEEFLQWLYSMEYKEHKLPKEDVVIFLYVPVETAQKLLDKTKAKGSAKGKDIYEVDLERQRNSIEMYKQLSKKYKHWEMVSCVDENGELLSKKQVHKKVLAVLKKRKLI